MRSRFPRQTPPEPDQENGSGVYWGARVRPQGLMAAQDGARASPASQQRPEDRHLKHLVAALACTVLLVFSTVACAAHDFELPGGENSRGKGFLRLSTLPPKLTIINFWRSDCPPCLRELPLLNRFATEHPEIRVVTIALQKPSETAFSPVSPQTPVIALHGPSQPQGLLARFGNRPGALPFTVVLNPERESCAHKTGEINEDWLEKSRRSCLPDTAP